MDKLLNYITSCFRFLLTPLGGILAALALALIAGIVFKTQICLGPYRCFGVGGVVTAVEGKGVRGFRSDSRHLAREDSQLVQHGLGVTPDLIQVWSSKNMDGPWDLVDSVLADQNQPEGTWITEVTSSSFRFVTGSVAPHSTHGYGEDRNAWAYYETQRGEDYEPAKVWFRFTALAFCLEGDTC